MPRQLIRSRRPIAEEGEEGGEEYLNDVAESDLYSDDSGLSEEEDEDEEDDDESEAEEEKNQPTREPKIVDMVLPNEKMNGASIIGEQATAAPPKQIKSLKPVINGLERGKVDNELMLNGFGNRPDIAESDGVDFDDLEGIGDDDLSSSQPPRPTLVKPAPQQEEKQTPTPEVQEAKKEESKPALKEVRQAAANQSQQQHETPFEKRKREHEEYKKKRDSDPAFVPNRGAFFMHDQRHPGSVNGLRPFGRGGRGRGGFRAGIGYSRDLGGKTEPANTTWKHDKHEELLAAERPPFDPQPIVRPPPPRAEAPRSFGKTVQVGLVQIVVNLPGMESPITFSDVPYKSYTRLPFYRPPLRRDKPVRISLPEHPIKYIFPSPQRSFIFVPRPMGQKQTGLFRGSHRNSIVQGGSRSIHGGSIHSPSVASPGMSRKSSIHIQQTNSPILPHVEQLPTPPAESEVDVVEEIQKPVVKLPPLEASPAPTPDHVPQTVPQAAPQAKPLPPQEQSTEITVSAELLQKTQSSPPSYPTPAPPIHDARGTPLIPMHQPRPQKTVNVTHIETPAGSIQYQNSQFTQYQESYAHSRNTSYASQPSGTPLPQIPERAVHAQPFQPAYSAPYYYPSPQPIPHSHPIQPQHYHSPYAAAEHQYTASPVPPAVQNPYAIPLPPPPAPVSAPPQMPATIAQESNGTVYFYDPSQYYAAYATAAVAYPVGIPITPAPDGMMPANGMYYYSPQPQTMYFGHQ